MVTMVTRAALLPRTRDRIDRHSLSERPQRANVVADCIESFLFVARERSTLAPKNLGAIRCPEGREEEEEEEAEAAEAEEEEAAEVGTAAAEGTEEDMATKGGGRGGKADAMASSAGRVPSSNSRSGYTPNVYWRSPTFQELRRLPGYRALPPPGFVELRCEACAPFFRQDSTEWAALHSGRVTTSALPGVLGMKERITSLKLKLPKGYASHHHALKVRKHETITSNRKSRCCAGSWVHRYSTATPYSPNGFPPRVLRREQIEDRV